MNPRRVPVRILLAGLMIAVVLAATACKRSNGVAEPPRPRLAAVEVQDVTSDQNRDAPLVTDQIAAAVRKQLLASGVFDAAAGPGAADGKGIDGTSTTPVV